MGAFDQPIPWSTNGLIGQSRFLQRIWELQDKLTDDAQPDGDTNRLIHQTIKHVGERIESMKFNTAVAALMTLANHFGSRATLTRENWETFLILLSPFAPHIAEELWSRLGHEDLVCTRPWPTFDPEQAKEETIEIPVQINGKIRARLTVDAAIESADLEQLALADEKVKTWTDGKTIRKVVVVPGRLVNIVAK